MCLMKIKAGLIISAFIYSDPLPVFSSPPCVALFYVWQEHHFINGSKLQGRAILNLGVSPPQENTQPACQRCTSHKHKGKYGIAKGVGGETKD